MPVYELQDSATPTKPQEPSRNRTERQRDHEGHVITRLQAELDGYYAELRNLNQLDPTSVMQKLSSISARAGELRAQLVRSESRRANALRTREVEPLLEQIKLQFQIHSRIVAVAQQELDLIRGQT